MLSTMDHIYKKIEVTGSSSESPQKAIENAVAAGRLTRERIARSYARIVALKARLGSR